MPNTTPKMMCAITTEIGGVIVADQVQAIRDTTIPPTEAAEAAIVADLNTGA